MNGRKIIDITAEELHALITDAITEAIQTAIKDAFNEGYKAALTETMQSCNKELARDERKAESDILVNPIFPYEPIRDDDTDEGID